jgi:urease accessory protein UreF
MKKFSMLGIVGGAALLAAVAFSLQWSQVGSSVPLLTVSHANAQTAGMERRQTRRESRRERRETRREARRAGRETRRAVRRGTAPQ